MKRKFSVIETVRMQYEVNTVPEFEAMLEEEELYFEEWLNANPASVIWSMLDPGDGIALEYLDIYPDTFTEELP